MLCHSITNAKACNGEAVPSTWRNCFSFVDLLGLGTTWGCHSTFYGVLLCFAVHSTHFPPLLLQPPMPFLSSSHFYASACQYFAHQLILAVHACGRWAENGLCCFALFLFCCYALPHLLFLYFASILGPLHCHPSPMSQGIFRLIFCSSADHSSVWFEVDATKQPLFTFSGLLLCFALGLVRLLIFCEKLEFVVKNLKSTTLFYVLPCRIWPKMTTLDLIYAT